MSIINQFKYYENKTKIYNYKINNAANRILEEGSKRKTFTYTTSDLEELSSSIFSSLLRITNNLNSKKHIMDKDILDQSDEINYIKKQISDRILCEIEKKDYQIQLIDNNELLQFKRNH